MKSARAFIGGSILAGWLGLSFVGLAVAAEKDAPRVAVAAYGEHGMVASVAPLATEAGVNALKAGGNAIDATAASNDALTPSTSCAWACARSARGSDSCSSW